VHRNLYPSLGTALTLTVLLACGCVRYEYDVAHPPEFAGHVGADQDLVFKRDPLEYRLITYDNRLVLRVFNGTEDAMQLVGERSTVVDPRGESHPLRTRPIAAQSNIKLIFPPMRPVVEQRGPTFGIGVGTVIGSSADPRRRYRDPFYDPWYDEPRYLSLVEDDALYWEWSGDGEIRLLLAYQRGDQTFQHDFVISRRKL
jgi:hypothetical protein